MRSLTAILMALGVLALGAAAFVWSGTYNIAATDPHWEITHEILETARDRSVEAHSKGITPPSLEDARYLDTGFHHYHPMCRLCHGAPGYPKSEFAQGLYPAAPNLVAKSVQEEWTDAQLYWIIKNGLKMTGMPAFGINHEEDELWAMVAFFRRLPRMKPEEYRALADAMGGSGENQEDGHQHNHQ